MPRPCVPGLPEAASRPQTARNVALVRAFIALRTDRSARPDAVFSDPARNGVPENERRGLELHFLVTRGAQEESGSLAGTLPTEVLMQPHLYRIARNACSRPGVPTRPACSMRRCASNWRVSWVNCG